MLYKSPLLTLLLHALLAGTFGSYLGSILQWLELNSKPFWREFMGLPSKVKGVLKQLKYVFHENILKANKTHNIASMLLRTEEEDVGMVMWNIWRDEELSTLIIIPQFFVYFFLYRYGFMIPRALYTKLKCSWLGGNVGIMERMLTLVSEELVASYGSLLTVWPWTSHSISLMPELPSVKWSY